ncbi:hypothetical protein ACFQX6_37930 [Streptosporangium lutulentum]
MARGADRSVMRLLTSPPSLSKASERGAATVAQEVSGFASAATAFSIRSNEA